MTFAEWRAKAEQGSVVAQGVIGMDYLLGADGVAVDHAEAFRWLAAAAAHGASRPNLVECPELEEARKFVGDRA